MRYPKLFKEPDAGTYRVTMQGSSISDTEEIGLVRKERHQSRRTYATGWRWFFVCPCHGYVENPDHGFETRGAAVNALLQHLEVPEVVTS